jgi:hypothetical protein
VQYRDFEVTVLPQSDDHYPVRVSSPAGDDQGLFRLPYSETELSRLIPSLSAMVARGTTRSPKAGTGDKLAGRPGDTPEDTPEGIEVPTPEEIGRELFESLFSSNVRALFERSQGMLHGERNVGLRIKLRIDLDEGPGLATVAGLPWEYMYRQDRREFLSLSMETPVVRYLEVPRPPEPLPLELPLRILFVLSSPQDQPELDLDREQQLIHQALKAQHEAGRVEFDILEHATASALLHKLDEREYHVVHYLGHATVDPDSGEGALCLEDAEGRTSLLPAHKLTTLLRDRKTVRLVFLNACQTAAMTGDCEGSDAFLGVTPALVMGGMTAVVAMQFPISDEAAKAFSEELYSQLARHRPVDEAVSKARQAVQVRTHGQEWGTPALFMRTSDGRVFVEQEAERAEVFLPPIEDRVVEILIEEEEDATSSEALLEEPVDDEEDEHALPWTLKLGPLVLSREVVVGAAAGLVLLVAALTVGLGLFRSGPSASLALVLDNGPGMGDLDAIRRMLGEELPAAPEDAALSLRIFGVTCGETRRVVRFSRGNAGKAVDALDDVQRVDGADLAAVIDSALDEVLGQRGDHPRMVLVLTAGQDTCGGDLASVLDSYGEELGGDAHLHVINLGEHALRPGLPGTSEWHAPEGEVSPVEGARAELQRVLGALSSGELLESLPAVAAAVAPSETPSSTPTGTSTPTRTSSPTSTPTETPTPTSTWTPTPAPVVMDRPWNAAWKELPQLWLDTMGQIVFRGEKLKCVRQKFQDGFMFWCDRQHGKHRTPADWEGPNVIFVIDEVSGVHRTWYFEDTWDPAGGQALCREDLALLLEEGPPLQGGFRKVWCENEEIRQAMRLPVEAEWVLPKIDLRGDWGPGLKELEGGYLLWDTYSSKIWVLIADLGWKSTAIGPGTLTPSPTVETSETADPSATAVLTSTWTPEATDTPSVTPELTATELPPSPSATP